MAGEWEVNATYCTIIAYAERLPVLCRLLLTACWFAPGVDRFLGCHLPSRPVPPGKAQIPCIRSVCSTSTSFISTKRTTTNVRSHASSNHIGSSLLLLLTRI